MPRRFSPFTLLETFFARRIIPVGRAAPHGTDDQRSDASAMIYSLAKLCDAKDESVNPAKLWSEVMAREKPVAMKNESRPTAARPRGVLLR